MALLWRYAVGFLVAGAPLAAGMAWAAENAPSAAATVDPLDSFQEMRLECLVLAEPGIGDTRLSFRKAGETLEVRGTCESVSARRAALDMVAREHKGTVRDLTTIAVIPSQPRKPMQPAALKKMASRRVRELVPAQAGAIQVESTQAGHLMVTGLSLSMEDKLEISRALKKLAGVVAVHNDLRVTPMVRDGRMVTLVTSDGRRFMDGSTVSARPAPAPAPPVEVAVEPKPAVANPLQPVAATIEEPKPERKPARTKPRDAQPPEDAARLAVTEAVAVRAVSRTSQPRLWAPPPVVTVAGKPLVHSSSGFDIQSAHYAAAHAQTSGDSKVAAWRTWTLGHQTVGAYAEAGPMPRQTPNGVPVKATVGNPAPTAPKAAIPELMPPPSRPENARGIQLPVSGSALPGILKPVSGRLIEEPLRGRMTE